MKKRKEKLTLKTSTEELVIIHKDKNMTNEWLGGDTDLCYVRGVYQAEGKFQTYCDW